eukprot:3063167-Rhodomonas_salina.1
MAQQTALPALDMAQQTQDRIHVRAGPISQCWTPPSKNTLDPMPGMPFTQPAPTASHQHAAAGPHLCPEPVQHLTPLLPHPTPPRCLQRLHRIQRIQRRHAAHSPPCAWSRACGACQTCQTWAGSTWKP